MTTTTMAGAENQLGVILQYTVEAYKTFQKLAEMLPNPISAGLFANLARDERRHRDLIEVKYLDTPTRMQITLGSDLGFQEMLEGKLSYRELAESLISREKTMERRLLDLAVISSPGDRNLLIYLAYSKRAHAVYLERELEMIKLYDDWFKREDAEDVIIHGRG